MAEARKVIITCAATGAIHTPLMSPHVPITAEEVAATVVFLVSAPGRAVSGQSLGVCGNVETI